MSRPRGRMPSERRWGMGKIGKGEHSSTRFGARTRMFETDFGRSHGWRRPKAHRRVPLDKRMSRRYPTSVGRTNGGDFSLATQRKVTRPGPKGGRNPIEDGVLASCVAKPRHQGHPQDWEFGLTPPGSRASEYASLFEPTGTHQIVNLRGTLTPLTLALSQEERGQRRRERQQAGKRKGAGQAPFDALIG